MGNTCAHWLDACKRASVPAGPVKSVAEALRSPTVIDRGIVQTVEHPQLGAIKLIRPAHGLAAQAAHAPKAPPLLGEDTRATLRAELGYDDAQIDKLVAAGVIACGDAPSTPAPGDAAEAVQ
jgi:crotonobetainyl-CoA:carnitine CoA-transferase CaiB-like acyl-CoA transferase